jgi:predicted metal-dependent phosphoesterase TrpH
MSSASPSTPRLLARGLEAQQRLRDARALRIAEKLDSAGAPGSKALAAIRAQGSLPTRTHFARALVAEGAAKDLRTAFDRWLGRGKPGDVKGEWAGLAEATAWIVAAGGKAVIAHPMRYPLSAGARRELCADRRQPARPRAGDRACRALPARGLGRLGLPRPRHAVESARSFG